MLVKKILLALVLIGFVYVASASAGGPGDDEASGKVVKCKVVDKETGEELTGVKIICEGIDIIYSDPMGEFELGLGLSEMEVNISYISYKKQKIRIQHTENIQLIELERL